MSRVQDVNNLKAGQCISVAHLQEIFSKFDLENKKGLNLKDFGNMLYSNINAFDPLGW